MSAPAPNYAIPWHCPTCHVEWTANQNQPQTCWICNHPATKYNDKTAPWTASGTYTADQADTA